MLKNTTQNLKLQEKTPKSQPSHKKSLSKKTKLKNHPSNPEDSSETQLVLSRKPPVQKKVSIDLQNTHSKSRKKSRNQIYNKTLLPHQLHSDLEKTCKIIDKNRAKSNLESSLKARLDLSQKIALRKNTSPKRVDLLIKNSLKKEKKIKILKEKEIKQKRLQDEIRKLENDYQNNLIRKINGKKFKVKKQSFESKDRTRLERLTRLLSSRTKTGRSVSSRRTNNEVNTVRSISTGKPKLNKYFAEDYDVVSHRDSIKLGLSNQDLYQSKTEKGVKQNISVIDDESDSSGHLERKKIVEKPEQINYKKYIQENPPKIDQKIKIQEFQQKRAARVIQKFYLKYKEKKHLKKEAELQSLVHEQISWREAQLLSLEYLKEKELEDLQSLSELFGQGSQLEEHLYKRVTERYDSLTQLFKENLKNTEEEIIQKMNRVEVLDFSNKIKDKKEVISKFIEDTKENASLDKEKVEMFIKETKEIQVSASCQTSIDLNPEPDSTKDPKQIRSVSISDILLFDPNIPLPVFSESSELGLENEDFHKERPSTSPIPARPHAPLMFLDTDDISLESLLNTSTPINSKNSLGLPLLNLNSIQGGIPNIPISSDPRIETSSNFISIFLTEIFEKLDRRALKSELSVGVEKNLLTELKKIRESDFGVIEKEIIKPVFNVKQIIDSIMTEGTEDIMTTQRFVNKADKIHKAMILQAADEVLQGFRPYGKLGIPVIWSEKPRKIGNFDVDIEDILKNTVKVIEGYSQYEIGKIANEDMILSNGRVDEETLQDIREDALGYSIKQEILENEWIWTDYEFEVAQVKIDLADMILTDLCEELVCIL